MRRPAGSKCEDAAEDKWEGRSELQQRAGGSRVLMTSVVAHAERRLAHAGMSRVQIEYSYDKGEPTSERLLAWYEGALGFKGPSHRNSGFRVCRKVLEPTGEIKYVCIRWICAILAWLCCGQY